MQKRAKNRVKKRVGRLLWIAQPLQTFYLHTRFLKNNHLEIVRDNLASNKGSCAVLKQALPAIAYKLIQSKYQNTS